MRAAAKVAVRSRFLRAEGLPAANGFPAIEGDTFEMAVGTAIHALSGGDLACASCGTGRPSEPCVVTSEKTGHMFGYALCGVCHAAAERSIPVVDAAFEAFEAELAGMSGDPS